MVLRWNEIEHLRQLDAEKHKTYLWLHPVIFDAAYYYEHGVCGYEQPHYPVPALLTETWVTESGEIFIVNVD